MKSAIEFSIVLKPTGAGVVVLVVIEKVYCRTNAISARGQRAQREIHHHVPISHVDVFNFTQREGAAWLEAALGTSFLRLTCLTDQQDQQNHNTRVAEIVSPRIPETACSRLDRASHNRISCPGRFGSSVINSLQLGPMDQRPCRGWSTS